MYKWNLEFLLKNVERLTGIYHGEEVNSNEVAKIFLHGNENTFVGCRGEYDCSNLFVRLGEIASLDISAGGKE